MKKAYCFLILVLLIACNDTNYQEQCSDIIVQGESSKYIISNSDLNTVKSIFESNHLSLNNLIVSRFEVDQENHKYIGCYQYVNDLIVFTGHVNFLFDEFNHYYNRSGDMLPNIEINASPKMDKFDLIKMFLDYVENDTIYAIFNGNQLEKIKEGCFRCELGYYDLNAGTSYSSPNFILAWKVSPENQRYPYAYINDTDKKLIHYLNGIYID